MSEQYMLGLGLIGIGFVAGTLFGIWIASRNKERLTSYQRSFISFVVLFIWTASMGTDIYTGANNTPLMLHLFMGAVIGSINPEFGMWLIKLINRK